MGVDFIRNFAVIHEVLIHLIQLKFLHSIFSFYSIQVYDELNCEGCTLCYYLRI